MRSRKWITGAALVAAAAAAAGQARAADLLFDDFSAASLDTSKWSLGTWQLGRTQLGFTPQLTGGMARLRHDTYNPSNPGGTFRGTEILSNNSFTRGSGNTLPLSTTCSSSAEEKCFSSTMGLSATCSSGGRGRPSGSSFARRWPRSRKAVIV